MTNRTPLAGRLNGYQQSDRPQWACRAQGQLGINDLWDPNSGLSLSPRQRTLFFRPPMRMKPNRLPTWEARNYGDVPENIGIYSVFAIMVGDKWQWIPPSEDLRVDDVVTLASGRGGEARGVGEGGLGSDAFQKEHTHTKTHTHAHTTEARTRSCGSEKVAKVDQQRGSCGTTTGTDYS